MNKYLLLRDNKESGPYSATELVAKGMKPYDLVWMEGKSAAWRYPSEIDELKDSSPVVEEQPYDRFYKKKVRDAGQVVQETGTSFIQPSPDHLAYLPKYDGASPKVYINFPGIQQRYSGPPADHYAPAVVLPAGVISRRSATVIKTESIPQEKPVVRNSSINYSSAAEPDINESFAVSSPVFRVSDQNRDYVPEEAKRSSVFSLINIFAAACLLLTCVLIVLLFNYNSQRKNLNQLNEQVEQIRQRDKQAAVINTASVAGTALPAGQSEQPDPINTFNTTADNLESASDIKNYNIPTGSQLKNKKAKVKPGAENAKQLISDPDMEKQNTAGQGAEMTDPSNAPKREKTYAPRAKDQDAPVHTNAQTGGLNTDNLYTQVTVKSNKYKIGVLGGVSDLQMLLTNNSDKRLQRVEVTVKYLGPEKKLVKSQNVYFDNVSPGQQLTIDVPKSNRGVSIEYLVSRID